MAKKLVIIVCLLVAVSGVVLWSIGRKPSAPRVSREYSVILITLDSLTARYLSSYGYHRNTTPNLDKFAKQHVRFSEAFGQSFYSGPSHASLLNSLYPRTHGVFRNSVWMDKDVLCLQEVLKGEGYKTSAVVNSRLLGEVFNFNQGFDSFEVVRGHPERKQSDAGYTRLFGVAEKWIEENKDNKFFLWLHSDYTHSFYKPRKDYQHVWYSEDDLSKMDIKVRYNHHRDMIRARERGILTEDEVKYAKSQYDAELFYSDELVHKFLSRLEKLVSMDNLLIVITADHGEIFDFKNNRFGHGHYLYEDVIKVPLIMAVPPIDGKRFDDLVIDEAVQGIDIAPTILDLLGIGIPPAFQGLSFADFFFEEPSQLRSELILGVGIVGEPVCIRKDGWKLIYYNDNKMELYNIAEDPHEDNDLASSRTDQVKKLLRLYKRWTKFVPHYDYAKLREKRKMLSPRIIEILRKSGYLEDETDLEEKL